MSIRIGLKRCLTVAADQHFTLSTRKFCCAAKFNQHHCSSLSISNRKMFQPKCATHRKKHFVLQYFNPNAAQFHTNTAFFNDDTAVSESSTNNIKQRITLSNMDTHNAEQFQTSKGVFTIDELHEHLNDVRGEDIFVLHLSKSLLYADYFVVVTATSPRHLMQMAETTNQLYKQRKAESDPFVVIEGKRDCDNWMCIDFGNIVVHFMLEEVRNKYQLEKLWLLGPRFDDQFNVAPEESDPLKLLELHSLDLVANKMGHVSVMEGEPLIDPWDTSYQQSKAESAKKDPDEDAFVV